MSDIFISYDSADRTKAKTVANALEQQGWSVWWDRKIPPGKKFDEVIENELDKAKCVVVLWSTESIKSDWVKEEATEATRRKILVPVIIDTVQIPLGFRRIQAASLVDWQGTSDHPEFEQILKSVAVIIGQHPSKKKTQPLDTEKNVASKLEIDSRKTQEHVIIPLSLPRRIYANIILSPSGDSLYLNRFREEIDFAKYWDLVYYDRNTGKTKLLADVGSDDIYDGFINELYFKGVSVKSYKTYKILCFNKDNEIKHPINNLIVDGFQTCKDKIFFDKNGNFFCIDQNGSQKRLDFKNDYWCLGFLDYPNRKIAIGTKIIKKCKSSIYQPCDHFFVEFDDKFNTKKEKRILSDTETTEYFFIGCTPTQILFSELTYTNIVRRRNYKNSKIIKSLNVDSYEITPVIAFEEPIDNIRVHQQGFIFYVAEVKQNQHYKLFIFDYEKKENHCIRELKNGSYQKFTFNQDWSVLAFKKVFDTNGKGTFYDWENESEVYYLELR